MKYAFYHLRHLAVSAVRHLQQFSWLRCFVTQRPYYICQHSGRVYPTYRDSWWRPWHEFIFNRFKL